MTKNRFGCFVLTLIVLFVLDSPAPAGRTLERTEVLTILQELTVNPRTVWIETGTIEAVYERYQAPRITDRQEIDERIRRRVKSYTAGEKRPEVSEELRKERLAAIPFNMQYRLANEQFRQSAILVHCDGDKLYQRIEVIRNTDTVQRPPDLEGNQKTKQFNSDWHGLKIFVDDATRCAMYFPRIDRAIIDTAGAYPRGTSGTLKAGLIPWGSGIYTYQELASWDISAWEEDTAEGRQVHLAMRSPQGLIHELVLDGEKDYAMLSSRLILANGSEIRQQCANYQRVGGNWVPRNVVKERFEPASGRLLTRDTWFFTSISAEKPASDVFDLQFAGGVLVEQHAADIEKPFLYRQSDSVDIGTLVDKKLAFERSRTACPQNCASGAMKYVSNRLGKDVADETLSLLVDDNDGQTSLYSLRQFAREIGLYAYAVKADLTTLKSLSTKQAILHMPGRRHFVVLDRIGDDYIWLIDLAGNRLYYRVSTHFFDLEWPDGTALLLSTEPVWFDEHISEIDDLNLAQIRGGSGYTCTKKMQDMEEFFCPPDCSGFYEAYAQLYGCEAAPSGSCVTDWFVSHVEAPCTISSSDPDQCGIISEQAEYYYKKACGNSPE